MSSSDERAAAVIAKHLEWARKFVLLYVVSSSPRRSQRLWERLGGRFVRMRLDDPSALASAERSIDALLHSGAAQRPVSERPLVWLEAGGRVDASMLRAWADLSNRLNERREQLRAYLRGLVVVIPEPLLAPVRAASPDLWSLRTSVVDLRGEAAPDAAVTLVIHEGARASDPELARRIASALERTEGELVRDAARLRAWVRVGDRASWARARTLADKIVLANPSGSESDAFVRRELARSLNEFADSACTRGELEPAARAWAQIDAALGGGDDSDPAALLIGAEAAIGLTQLHLRAGALDRARASLEHATALDERVMAAHSSPLTRRLALLRAELARAEGKLDEARLALELAVDVDRGPESLLRLGRVLAQLGEHPQAYEILREAAGLASGDSSTLRIEIFAQLAGVARARGNLVEAVDLWTRAEQLAGDDEALLLMCIEARASLLGELDERARARVELERALDLRERLFGSTLAAANPGKSGGPRPSDDAGD